MYKGHQIYSQEIKIPAYIYSEKYFGPTCYWNMGSLEPIVMSIRDDDTIHVDVNKGNWYFICKISPNPTLENPCIGIIDNGSAERKYDLFFSQSKQCWVWNNRYTPDDGAKFRYISLSTSDAERNKSTNLAGLER